MLGDIKRVFRKDEAGQDACVECGEPVLPGAGRCEDCLG